MRWSLLFAALLAGPAATCFAVDDTSAKQQELEQLRSRIQALRDTLADKHTAQKDLLHSLKTSEQAIGRIGQRLRELDAEVRQHNMQLARLQQEQEQLANAVSGQRRALAAQVRAAYLMGHQDRLKMLLNQQDPARVGRGLLYYDYFNRARVDRITQASADLAQLAAATQAIEQQRAHLTGLRLAQQQEKEMLDEGRQARTLILARLNADIHSKDTELERLLKDERALHDLLQRLPKAARMAEQPGYRAFAALKGKLPWPAHGVTAAPFGGSRLGDRTRWQGTLIEGQAGDEVRAVSPGRIVFAEWLRGFGLMTIIDHGDGYMTLYGHNQTLYKKVNDWVATGDVIGAMGVSGGFERPGVYFEIREQGVPRDPFAWCRPQEPNHSSNN